MSTYTPQLRHATEREHSELCAQMVKSYWLAEGCHVQVHVVELPWVVESGVRIYGVRSDLVNGKPAGFRE